MAMDFASIDYSNTPASKSRNPLGYALREAEPPLVTIVTPFYNTGSVFWETHASIHGQTFQAWEWIIVDDCSTDAAALELLRKLEGSDPRIRVIRHEQNRGLAASRNTGVASASCEFVVLLDSDDMIEPTAIESWLWFLRHHPGFAFVNGAVAGFGAEQFVVATGFREREAFLKENRVNCICMIRRSIYLETGGMDEQRRGGLEDWEFWLRCASLGHWGETLPELHGWYRRRSDHADRWSDYDQGGRQAAIAAELQSRYGESIQRRGFPPGEWLPDSAAAFFESPLTGRNRLKKANARAIVATCQLKIGGADVFVLRIVGALKAAGYEVSILVTDSQDNPKIDAARSLTQDCMVLSSFLSPELRHVFVDYCIKSRDTDLLVIANSAAAYSWAPWLRHRNPGLIVIDYLHMEQADWRQGGYPRYAAIFDSAIDSHGVSSLHLKNWLVAQGVSGEKVQLIYTGSDSALFDPERVDAAKARARIGLDDDRLVITFVGRLCAQKRIDLLCEILAELAEDPDLKFKAAVVGDGPDSPLVRKLVESDDSRRILWLGTQTAEQIRDLLGISNVLLLPSAMEGIALTIYEAMFMGVTVVASNVGGQRELVQSGGGFLIDHHADEKAEYVRVLRSLIADPSRTRQMGAEGMRRARSEFANEQIQSNLAAWMSSARRASGSQTAKANPAASQQMALYLQSAITTEEEKLAVLGARLGSVEAALEKSKARVSKLEQRAEKLAAERDKLKARERELRSAKKSGLDGLTRPLRSLLRRLFAGGRKT